MSTPSYKEYLSQIEDLQKKAAAARKAEIDGAIREVRRLIAEYGLTPQDLGLEKSPRRKREAAPVDTGRKNGIKRRNARLAKSPVRKVPPKYIGPNGELWTGRGRRPQWVVTAIEHGATLSDLQIPAGATPAVESAT